MNKKTVFQCALMAVILIGGCWFYCATDYRVCRDRSTAAFVQEEPVPEESVSVVQHKKIFTTDPDVLIQRLWKLSGNKKAAVQEAAFCFQGLYDANTNAIEAICKYITSGHNFTLAGVRSKDSNRVQSPYVVPATTRVGVEEVLHDIGGIKAAELLSQALLTVQDVYEAIYVANLLFEIAPGSFNDQICQTAKIFLANTNSPEERKQLLSILSKLGDMEMIEELTVKLIVDGKLDSTALQFLKDSLKENVLPILAEKYRDTSLDEKDRRKILRTAFTYVGSNLQANEMFWLAYNELGDDMNLKVNLICELSAEGKRAFTVIKPDPETGILRSSVIEDDRGQMSAETAQARLDLVKSFREQNTEPDVEDALDRVEQLLNYKLHPESFDKGNILSFDSPDYFTREQEMLQGASGIMEIRSNP